VKGRVGVDLKEAENEWVLGKAGERRPGHRKLPAPIGHGHEEETVMTKRSFFFPGFDPTEFALHLVEDAIRHRAMSMVAFFLNGLQSILH